MCVYVIIPIFIIIPTYVCVAIACSCLTSLRKRVLLARTTKFWNRQQRVLHPSENGVGWVSGWVPPENVLPWTLGIGWTGIYLIPNQNIGYWASGRYSHFAFCPPTAHFPHCFSFLFSHAALSHLSLIHQHNHWCPSSDNVKWIFLLYFFDRYSQML